MDTEQSCDQSQQTSKEIVKEVEVEVTWYPEVNFIYIDERFGSMR